MKKKGLALLMAGICTVTFGVGVVADDLIDDIKAQLRRDFTVKIDGDVKEFKNKQGEVVYPVLYDGTTYLPLRAIGEMMGKTVYWYENDKRIELKEGASTVTDADVIVTDDVKQENKLPDKKDPEEKDFISVGEAKKIALDAFNLDASDVKFRRVELDKDDGVFHYEVKLIAGDVEYEIEIGAVNGVILSREIDDADDDDFKKDKFHKDDVIREDKPAGEYISKEKAKELALKRAGITTSDVVFRDFDMDYDNGVYHYEIEFVRGGIEYDIDIRAEDGSVIKYEEDRD